MHPEGIVVPMVTPVTGRSGDVDSPVLRQLTEHLVEHGVDALVPCGTTGEFSCFSREQRRQVIQTVVNVSSSVPVLAGCGATSMREVKLLIDDAAEAGADVVVVVTPYYHTGTQEGLVDFFEAVADTSPLPILLYHIPTQTGQELHPERVGQLAGHPSIVGIKESTGDVRYLNELIQSTPDSFSILQGGVINAPTALLMGADGIVPGEANFVPSVLRACYDAFDAGEYQSGSDPFWTVNELSRPFLNVPVISAIKHLTECAGFDVGPPLPPLSELDDETKSQLNDRYEAFVRR